MDKKQIVPENGRRKKKKRKKKEQKLNFFFFIYIYPCLKINLNNKTKLFLKEWKSLVKGSFLWKRAANDVQKKII